MNFSEKYENNLESEMTQFLYLINESDAKMLVQRYKRSNLKDYARLACIALLYGYKKVFLKIFATVERDIDKFMAELDSLNGNFALFESWINNFINGIENEAALNLTREYWEERKQKMDKVNFTVHQIL